MNVFDGMSQTRNPRDVIEKVNFQTRQSHASSQFQKSSLTLKGLSLVKKTRE
jgi:hypothetical protein